MHLLVRSRRPLASRSTAIHGCALCFCDAGMSALSAGKASAPGRGTACRARGDGFERVLFSAALPLAAAGFLPICGVPTVGIYTDDVGRGRRTYKNRGWELTASSNSQLSTVNLFRTGAAGGGATRGRNIRRLGLWPRARAGCDQSSRSASGRARTFLRWRLPLR